LTPYHFLNGAPSDFPEVNKRREFQGVTAACMLVRKEILEEVGGFDENFVNGFEDIDFCLKVRELGWKIVYQPLSCLYHLESQTQGRKNYDSENAHRFLHQWEHKWIEDEDIMAFEIGCSNITSLINGKTSFLLANFRDEADRQRWSRVVEVQKSLIGIRKNDIETSQKKDQLLGLLKDPQWWPCDIGALEYAGRVCEVLGCEQEANNFWKKLLEVGDHPNARLGLTRDAIKNGKLDEGQHHLDVLRKTFSPKSDSWTLQGIILMQKQEFSNAKNAFETALVLDAHSKKARVGIGMAYMGMGSTQEAWELFQQILSDYPDDVEAMNWIIQSGTVLQKWEPLANLLSRYVTRNPANCDMRFALAGVEFRAGNVEKAKEQFEMLSLLKPDYTGLEDLSALVIGSNPQEELVLAP